MLNVFLHGKKTWLKARSFSVQAYTDGGCSSVSTRNEPLPHEPIFPCPSSIFPYTVSIRRV